MLLLYPVLQLTDMNIMYGIVKNRQVQQTWKYNADNSL